MTKDQWKEAKERCEAATAGPWTEVSESGEWWVVSGLDSDSEITVVEDTDQWQQYDVDFMVHAREDLPNALEALSLAWAEIERLKKDALAYRLISEVKIEDLQEQLEEARRRT